MNFNMLLEWLDKKIEEEKADMDFYLNRSDEMSYLHLDANDWADLADDCDYDISIMECIRSCILICRHEMEERHGKR